LSSLRQLEPDAPYGFDVIFLRNGAYLAADIADVDVDGLVLADEEIIPCVFVYLLLAECLVGIQEKQFQYLKSEMNRLLLRPLRAWLIFCENPDLHTAPKQSIIKSLQIRSDIDEQSEQIKETNTVG
jgi:hypothetical protein